MTNGKATIERLPGSQFPTALHAIHHNAQHKNEPCRHCLPCFHTCKKTARAEDSTWPRGPFNGVGHQRFRMILPRGSKEEMVRNKENQWPKRIIEELEWFKGHRDCKLSSPGLQAYIPNMQSSNLRHSTRTHVYEGLSISGSSHHGSVSSNSRVLALPAIAIPSSSICRGHNGEVKQP